MALPVDYNTVPVHGKWVNLDGSPASGTVTFIASIARLVDVASETVIMDCPFTVSLDDDGEISVNVPSTDDPDLDGTPFQYQINVDVSCGSYVLSPVDIPIATVGTIELATLSTATPIATLPGTYVVSINGHSGILTGADLGLVAFNDDGSLDMTGVLVIDAVGAGTDPVDLPYGYGQSDAATGIVIESGYPSDDVTGGADGTGRIDLYSYQRANAYSFGETIRHHLMRRDSKAMESWYVPVSGSSPNLAVSYTSGDGRDATVGAKWTPAVWAHAHVESNSHSGDHMHYEIEVPDVTGALQGRFEIQFGNPATGQLGLDKTQIQTNLADLVVRTHGTDHTGANQVQMLRMSGVSGFNKDIQWCNDTDGVARRWALRATSEAEAGSNAGQNFQLVRYDDSGTIIDSPVIVNRASGQVQIGGTGGASAGLLVTRAATGGAVTINQNAASGIALAEVLTDVASRAIDARVSGDANARLVLYADGKHEWGAGLGARDVNLYRSATGVLKTDNTLLAATALQVGASGLNVPGMIFARKTADESVTSSVALQDDDHLTFAVEANSTYLVEGYLIYDGDTAGDLLIGFSGPASATFDWSPGGLGSASAGTTGSMKLTRDNIAGTEVVGGFGAGVKGACYVRGILITAGTAGTFKLQWAQGTSSAVATHVFTNSYLTLRKVA